VFPHLWRFRERRVEQAFELGGILWGFVFQTVRLLEMPGSPRKERGESS
jgi:hypothetical protein